MQDQTAHPSQETTSLDNTTARSETPANDTAVNAAIKALRDRGKIALDRALGQLTALVRDSPDFASGAHEILADLEREELVEALSRCDGRPVGVVRDDIATALAVRNEALDLAMRAHSGELRRLAGRFGDVRGADEAFSCAWVIAVRKFYSWRGDGPFIAWLRKTVLRVLLTLARTRDERASQQLSDLPDPAHYSTETQGTMTKWIVQMMRYFRDSLEEDKQALWDDWECMGVEGMQPEEIYRALAQVHDKTVPAVKMTLHRLEADFRETIGANKKGVVNASHVLAIWVGSQRRGSDTAIVVTGIDVDDRLRLIAARHVTPIDARAFKQIFWTLQRWGLPHAQRMLVVADDSPGLDEALSVAFPDVAVVQPCLNRFIMAVARHAPSEPEPALRRRLEKAFAARNPKDAQALLMKISNSLARGAPTASALIRDKLDALLIVKSFQLPDTLEEQLTRVDFLATQVERPVPWLMRHLRLRRSVPRRREGLQQLRRCLTGG